ncbi:rhomboid family intramembrane serine protease [Clostridium hydrogenum]|uniref:rhomboid family intramembrane serine protease n=1 Tax=Clostridium hydrogenum TaxID=2855764 RepID=UPI001F1CA656|nr:rhomboid family intramembrane serine protease [Clostridium hydrogenum]
MDKLEKYLIEELCNKYGCVLNEFENHEYSHQFWTAKFKVNDFEHYIIFSHEKDFKYIDNSSCSNINISDVYDDFIIKVLLVEKRTVWQQHLEFKGKGKLIVIDKETREILYCDNDILQIGDILQNSMSLIQDNSEKNKYLVTWTLIGINVIVYIICAILSRNPIDIDINVLNRLGAKNNELILNGQYYRLFTCMFLHGGLLHIASNMYSLYCVGYMVEKVYGKAKYLSIYLISGIISSVFSFLFSDAISIGASGAIFGVLGAVFVFSFMMRDKIGKQLLINIVSVIVLNIFITMSVPNIDIFAHIGGFIGGVLISLMLGRNLWSKKAKI